MRSSYLIPTLVLTGLCLVLPATAQRVPLGGAAPAANANPTLTNADIMALAAAGIDDAIIIDKIHSSPSRSFDTSVEGLKALRGGNVSNAVIREMMSSAVTTDAAANSNDPGVIHPPGVYVMLPNHDGSTHLVMLEHTRSIGEKTSGNTLAMAYGLSKKHTKVELNGPKSPVQLDDMNPTFYLYIPEDVKTFGGSDLSARDFELLKLHVGDKTREVQTAAQSMMGMGNTGVDDKTRQTIQVNKVKPGIYMVKLAKPLKAGEYAFEHELDGVYYDFGVREAK